MSDPVYFLGLKQETVEKTPKLGKSWRRSWLMAGGKGTKRTVW